MNRLDTGKRAAILRLLVEGNSVASTSRVTGASKHTILSLLGDVGAASAAYQDRVMRDLDCKRLQLDEQWSYVGMKEKNVPNELRGTFGYGDVYVWSALDATTKLIPCWHVGTRDARSAFAFVHDLKSRLRGRVQIVSDGHRPYIAAIDDAFGAEVDFAQLIKLYGTPKGLKEDARRYSPGECIGARKRAIRGRVPANEISTSYIERANLTMRMHNRRLTRLTNAFSKKLENHMHAISLHFMFYNFCRQHSALRVTPAMEAGVTDHIWTMEEVVEMADTNV